MDLALNVVRRLIRHKTQPINQLAKDGSKNNNGGSSSSSSSSGSSSCCGGRNSLMSSSCPPHVQMSSEAVAAALPPLLDNINTDSFMEVSDHKIRSGKSLVDH